MTIRDALLELVGRAATARVRRRFRLPKNAREVMFWARDGVRLGGWLFDVERARGTVVVAHGYRDDRRQLAHLAPHIAELGLRTLAFDFRAHGASDGKWITIGHDEALDVEAALDLARSLGGPTSWVGFSMGASSYLHNLCRGGKEADSCAILDSPFDTLREAIGARLDRFRVPRSLAEGLIRLRRDVRFPEIERCRPIVALPKIARPTLLLFAPDDPWLPDATRDRFRRAMSASCTLHVLETGAHDDHVVPTHRGARAWRQTIVDFLAAHAARA